MTPKGVVGIGRSLPRERPGFFDARCIGFLFGGRGITPEGVVGIGHSLLRERTGIFDARCVGLLFRGRGVAYCVGILRGDALCWDFPGGSTCLVHLLGPLCWLFVVVKFCVVCRRRCFFFEFSFV